MSTSSTVSLNDVNVELARSATASINMNDTEVRFFASQTVSTIATQIFTGTGTWTCPSNVTSIEYLVVAGGGGGGVGGGGGAGGFLRGRVSVTPGAVYTMTVGGGGAIGYDGFSVLNQNGNGGNSSIVGTGVSIVAIGGGGGASAYYGTSGSGYRGGDGGSGGGGGGNQFADSIPNVGGSGTAGQGRAGGASPGYGCSPAGGGGGADYAGGVSFISEVSTNLRQGGRGKASSISGSLVYYSGGGAGGSYCDGVGTGGLGGGGSGGVNGGPSSTAGTPNTGGGGGGSIQEGVGSSTGGSGIIIIRYYTPTGSGSTVDMNSMRNLAPPFAGTSYGLTLGGADPGAGARSANIERISFASDGNSSILNYLSQARGSNNGHQNEVYGWTTQGSYNPTAQNVLNRAIEIERILLSTGGQSQTVGSLDTPRNRGGGTSSRTHGYAMSGINLQTEPSNDADYIGSKAIERFSFTTASQQATVGDLTTNMTGGGAGLGSLSHGFHAGGIRPPAPSIGGTAVIDRFPFAYDNFTITNIGNLSVARGLTAGASSPTHGYTTGGLLVPATRYATIDRFPFASTGNASGVGSLTANNASVSALSSVNNGYVLGGALPTITNVIQKFAFASSSNASNIGSLVSNRIQMGTACD